MSYNLPSLSLAAPMLKWPGFEMPLPVVSKLMVSVCPSLCWPLGTWCHRGAVRGDAATARLPAPALHACGAAAPTRAPLVPMSLSRWREPPLIQPCCRCTAPRIAGHCWCHAASAGPPASRPAPAAPCRAPDPITNPFGCRSSVVAAPAAPCRWVTPGCCHPVPGAGQDHTLSLI